MNQVISNNNYFAARIYIFRASHKYMYLLISKITCTFILHSNFYKKYNNIVKYRSHKKQ